MPLWLPEAAARIHPLAIDRLLVEAGLAPSLTRARRAIADGSCYWNNQKLTPPQLGFLPVLYAPGYPELYEWIWEALGDGEISANPGAGSDSRPARQRGPVAHP